MGPRSTRLDKLAASLEVNPSLGNWVQHLPDFGELTYGLLGPASISPAGLSKTVLSILDKTPNLISLDLPSVQLKDQVRFAFGVGAGGKLTDACRRSSYKSLQR